MAVIQRPCRHCNKIFPAKTSRAMFCSDSCRTLHGRAKRSTTKTVVIGRLSVVFEDCAPELTLDQLEAIVRQELTPELIELIHSDKPIQITGESQHA